MWYHIPIPMLSFFDDFNLLTCVTVGRCVLRTRTVLSAVGPCCGGILSYGEAMPLRRTVCVSVQYGGATTLSCTILGAFSWRAELRLRSVRFWVYTRVGRSYDSALYDFDEFSCTAELRLCSLPILLNSHIGRSYDSQMHDFI